MIEEALFRAALAAEASGDIQGAIEGYEAILAKQPGCPEALTNLGVLASRSGDSESALLFYEEAVRNAPTFVPARLNRARVLMRTGDMANALGDLERVIADGSVEPSVHADRAHVLLMLGRPREALAHAEAAAARMPDRALWLVLGNALLAHRRPREAELSYRKVPEDGARMRANLGLALMAQGRFDEAWPYYEARYDETLQAHDVVRFDSMPCPQWAGENLSGKRVLVVGEQGFGDQIQFVRFIEVVAQAGAHVELICRPALASLLGTAPGVSKVHVSAHNALETTFDYWTPMLSLPYRLGVGDPRKTWTYPYLQADEAKRAYWKHQLAAWGGNKRKVGLVWSGAAGNSNNRMRSMGEANVIAMVNGLTDRNCFVALQKGLLLDSIEPLCRAGIIPLEDVLKDFSDTAALEAELDLVITVDTATAHEAGALGRPTWVLLFAGADWRWGDTLGEVRCVSYPSQRLFWRTLEETNWDRVVAEVRAGLQ